MCILRDCYFVSLAFFYALNVQFYSYVGWVNSRDLNATVFIENNARKMQNLDIVTPGNVSYVTLLSQNW